MRLCERPCPQCPWRRDTPAGKFSAERYEALSETSGTRGAEAGLDAPMFACHMTDEGAERACAGWLAVVGYEHLGVRLALLRGRLDPAVLRPAPDWPPLFGSYEEMVRVQAPEAPGDNRRPGVRQWD